jgi:hypothetical protein
MSVYLLHLYNRFPLRGLGVVDNSWWQKRQTYYTQIVNIGGDYFIYLHMLRKIINKNYVSLRCIYCSYNCSHDQIPEQSSSSVVVTVTNLTTGISLLLCYGHHHWPSKENYCNLLLPFVQNLQWSNTKF